MVKASITHAEEFEVAASPRIEEGATEGGEAPVIPERVRLGRLAKAALQVRHKFENTTYGVIHSLPGQEDTCLGDWI